ncbi:1-alkyl-2-acetylglycerophosphocholine esterase [Parastagonospora nodorum]|nr:1-alkyl-2-acetylglycerophosphocholine esterase [Parastagonospora nodorum]KAH4980861.1 1-alkyl-2-acetylglycerophosphocholine esterase [Parastagonospora nodorum]KAH5094881.1 1-alkyl-2-acetylglycerophosphocholine esterase [Parastagonospora nodorum]
MTSKADNPPPRAPLPFSPPAPHQKTYHPIYSAPEEVPSTPFRPSLIIAMGGILYLLAGILAICSPVVSSVLLPGPDDQHQYKIAVADIELIDTMRKDPHSQDEDRKIMVSLFMPVPVANCAKEVERPYMSSPAAIIADFQMLSDTPVGVFDKIAYTVCSSGNSPINMSDIPVVVLEPHTDTSRLLYANLARYMTANNVAVVLIDHPYDSSVVEFPDKSVVYQNGATGLSNYSPLMEWNSTVETAVSIRIADIKFALSQLGDASKVTKNFPDFQFSGTLNTTGYSVVGHGLGGTVATSLSTEDPNVIISINLSGSAPPLNHTSAAPIFFIGRSDFRRNNDILWPSFWTHLTGPATEFDLANSGIMDFTDLPIVVEASNRRGLKGHGVGESGAAGNHAIQCFVEGILADNLHNNDGGVRNCIHIFGDRMAPYMLGRPMEAIDKRSSAKSRRSNVAAAWRHTMENWGFL